MARKSRIRSTLVALSMVTLFLGGFGWLTYHRIRQAKLSEPLIAAVKARDAARVRELLDRGADPNARARLDATPGGWARLLRTLLGGASNTSHDPGDTPALMLAAAKEDRECVSLLLAAGADPNATDTNGNTAVETLLCNGSTSDAKYATLRLLLDGGANVNARNRSGYTALIFAVAYSEKLDCVRLLLTRGVKVDARDDQGWTALQYAINARRADLVRPLLESGADVNTTAKDGVTCLRRSILAGDAGIVKLLLDRG